MSIACNISRYRQDMQDSKSWGGSIELATRSISGQVAVRVFELSYDHPGFYTLKHTFAYGDSEAKETFDLMYVDQRHYDKLINVSEIKPSDLWLTPRRRRPKKVTPLRATA